MKIEKTKLQDMLEDAGVEVRSYSGRCMYGRSCLGATGESVEGIFADLIQAMADSSLERSEIQEIADLVRDGRSDSMGRDVIVYWPQVRFAEEETDDEEAPESEDDCPESATCP